ncbi:hypothetical protein O3P69_000797 [Scylla paramamosain]|uniref:Uncharacterized protein n=1 Tax=Scylla paramamosain TaxID=85552 RepID=A0AAW0UVX1_SCYPA
MVLAQTWQRRSGVMALWLLRHTSEEEPVGCGWEGREGSSTTMTAELCMADSCVRIEWRDSSPTLDVVVTVDRLTIAVWSHQINSKPSCAVRHWAREGLSLAQHSSERKVASSGGHHAVRVSLSLADIDAP